MIPTNTAINTRRFMVAMEAGNYKVVDAAAVCGVSKRTLTKILRGEFPARIDAFYRAVRGLGIPMKEATLNASTPKTARLYVLPDRRSDKEIA